MEEKRYEEKGRVFESVKIPQTYFKNGPLGIYPPAMGVNTEGPKGIVYNNEITQVNPFINAVDIDWNKANVGKDGQIETTADLLNWIQNSATDLRTTMFNLAKSGDLVLAENGFIKNLWSQSINTDYLTVNKAAHFFELIIDKINSVQGIQINTAANCIADFIKTYNEYDEEDSINIKYFRVYWRSSDSDGNSTDNCWLINDQAYCQTFNAKTTNNNAGNTYYWRLVINTSNDVTDKTFINFDKGEIKTLTDQDLEENSDAFSFQIKFSNLDTVNFNVTGTQNEWEGNTWIPVDIQSQLTLEPIEEIGNCQFSFNTDIKTKLDIKVQYVDGSQTYTKANEYKTEYSIPLENKFVQKIIITTQVIDQWQPCHWIDLSNVTGDDDAREVDYNSTMPSVGDNICQLGYRYTNLDGYVNTAEWKQNNQDKISRASAIIIAAYATPDSGIVPPSYAQYQNITNFENLASHRKTYFDAIGAKFVGDFEVVSNLGEESQSVIEYLDSLRYDNPLQITSNIDSIFLRTDDNNQIDITEDGLNNFPSVITTSIFYENVQVSPTSLSVELNLTGTSKNYTVDLTNNTVSADSNTDKIYLSTVSLTDNNYLLGFSCAEQTGTQTINNGSQVIIRATYEDSTLNKTFYAQKVIPITGINVTAGSNGQNAEIWKLYKVKEYAVVSAAEDISVSQQGMLLRPGLTVNLQYKIQHVSGTTYDYNNDSEYIIKVRQYTPSGIYIPGSEATLTKESGIYKYEHNDNDWYSSGANNNYNKCNYLIVNLINNTTNEIVDSSIVSVMLKPTSLFKVKEGLTQSIQAQGRNFSILNQTVDTINATVGSHTNDLTALRSNISEIAQTANGISLSASNIVKIQNGEFPEDTDYEKYIFYKENQAPNTPEGEITSDTSDAGVWTTYRLEPSSVYQYVWISKKTLSQELDLDGSDSEEPEWSEWSTPILFQKYGQDRGYASKADLTITADGIRSEVSNSYVTTEGLTETITSSIQMQTNSIKTEVQNALSGNISSIESTAENISLSINNIIGELSKIGINISGNDSKIKLIANSTDFYTPTERKMISVEMCTKKGKIDHERGTIPSIVFYNDYGTPIWILNYLVGMQKVYITNKYSWDQYNLIKIGNNTGGMAKCQVIYPEAFFPQDATIEKPSISEAQPRGSRIFEESAYKFNAAYGEAIEGGAKSYIPEAAGQFDGSFWINTLVNNEAISDGWIPDDTNNTSLNGYYILRKADDNSSFNVIDDQNFSGVNAFNSLDINGDTSISLIDQQVSTAANSNQLSHNYSIRSEQEIDYQPGGYTISNNYTVGTQPAFDGDIFAEFEHYDEYILLEFENGCVINRFEFMIYYKTLVNRKNNIIKYVLQELEDGQPVYVSKVIIRKGTNSIESEWITINGIIELLSE